ncbi:hypothetical protein SHKM778_78520 [Streptomyces sp. KM77-8]|uniref:Cytochrome b/b6 domain-containing protein n=1 Tax=Streptomyces haneummycinicus TaxID=3074435 RepID=A0AAT9HVR6_9ACTN
MRPDDSTADDWLAEFLSFGVGVLSLVCLSCSVIWGLVAQDRILLGPRQRILAQAVHRTTAVASIVFLLVHIGIKLGQEHTSWIAAVLPFGLLLTDDETVTGRAFLIGLGTLAGMLMIFVGITGVLRNRFASPAPVAARWRAMHMLAYPAWCAALVHGLYAGRAAKPVFLILYMLSMIGVMGALAIRASPARVKRRISDRLTALLGTDQRREREERLEESRSRMAESALPGYGGRGSARGDDRPRGERSRRGDDRPRGERPRYESAERAPAPDPANGFAAAYRAVSTPGQPPSPTPPRGWNCRWTCSPHRPCPRSWTAPPAPRATGRSRPRGRSARPRRRRTTCSRTRDSPSRPMTIRPAPGTARVMCTTPVRRTPPTARTTRVTRTTAVPPMHHSPARRRPTTSTRRVRANLEHAFRRL